MNVYDAHNNTAFVSSAFSRTAASNAVPSTFASRRGAARSVVAVASTGLLVGMGAVGVSPALAALAPICDVTVTATANSASSAAALQVALSGVAPVVCLSGTFTLAEPLTFNRNLTLQGLAAGTTLDGDGETSILFGISGDLTVNNLTFANGAAVEDAESGGAIKANGNVAIFNSEFSNNFGRYGGGAIFAPEGDVSINESTFVDNVTGPQFGEFSPDGGAVFALRSIQVLNSTFVDNFAEGRGGALFAQLDVETIGSTFENNSSNDGGAIYSLESISSINSTFVANAATGEGGAIVARGGYVDFSTFLNNTAATPVEGEDVPGEAIYLELNSGTTDLFLSGNIFAGSGMSPQVGVGLVSPDPSAIRELENNVYSTTEALEEDLGEKTGTSIFGASISDIFGANPELADNGGMTETVALVAESPAVDLVERGGVVLPSGGVAPADADDFSDQRGESRVGLLDAGAFELQPSDAITPAPAPELAATGMAPTSSVLGGFAALIIALGAAFVASTRRHRVS